MELLVMSKIKGLNFFLQALKSTDRSKPCSFAGCGGTSRWLRACKNNTLPPSRWVCGSQGLQVESTALSWSCSPRDGQATRWAAKLVLCHPLGKKSSENRFASTSPPIPVPHPSPDSTTSSPSPLATNPAPAALSSFHLKLYSSPDKIYTFLLFKSLFSPRDNEEF